MRRIDILELGALEAMLLIERNRAVEDRLAGDAVIADARVARGIVRRIERVAAHARDGDDVGVSLEAGVHGPDDALDVEQVDVLVHEPDMLELGERGECEQGGLTLEFLQANGF